jgi:chloramphenicol 3-O-phosphotransferase
VTAPHSLGYFLGDVRFAARDGGVCFTHRRSEATLWLRGGRLQRGERYESCPADDRRELARAAAMVRLRARGRWLVHAAGAVDPAGRAWLLAGDSGSGKSTLAYALARAGWSSLGDDGVLVEVLPQGIMAYAWRDALRVSTTLGRHFPELRGRTAFVRPGDPRRRVLMAVPPASRAPVAAVVFLERAPVDAMHALARTETLAALVRQSPWVMIDDAHAGRHLSALSDVARRVPAFHLRHSSAQLRRIDRTLLETIA